MKAHVSTQPLSILLSPETKEDGATLSELFAIIDRRPFVVEEIGDVIARPTGFGEAPEPSGMRIRFVMKTRLDPSENDEPRAALATLLHACPMGFHDGKLIAGRSFTDADMIAWLQDLQRLASGGEPAAPVAPPLTEPEMHARCIHPDYEYETTTTARKSGDSFKPDGEGWEPNPYVVGYDPSKPKSYDNGRNWERFEFTENEYWMRRKVKP